MKQPQQQNDYELNSIFPTPVYIVKRDSNLDSKQQEEAELEDIIEEGMKDNPINSSSENANIFDTKLKNIKEFCEKHIRTYVKEIISPKKELDFYITQSWLNVTKPGEGHHIHNHANSIISGVFYIATIEENDKINFYDSSLNLKDRLKFEIKEHNYWNASIWIMPVEKNNLLLFPSWLPHGVEPNEKATIDRISISFNTFARGIFGNKKDSNELILE